MTFDQALKKYWHPVAMADEITAEPQQFRLLGQTFVASRTDDEVVVLKNRCVHLPELPLDHEGSVSNES